MNLINKTPFPALMYSSADADQNEHRIVVMKVSYKIVRHSKTEWGPELIEDGSVPLCLADEYWGEVGKSSVKIESDLAPYKPKCDVVINGTAYTPDSKEMTAIAVRFKLSVPEKKAQIQKPIEPQPLNPRMGLTRSQVEKWEAEKRAYLEKLQKQGHIQYKTQLEKTLSILGESSFKPNLLMPGWKKTSLKKFTQLPIRWEYAFGGHHELKVNETDQIPLYQNMSYTNPLGVGWVENQYFEYCERTNSQRNNKSEKIQHYKVIPAPRVEYHMQRQPKPAFVKQSKAESDLKRMTKIASSYLYKPAGFGFVGRSWLPRISKAGTYDQKWLDEQHPYPPFDLDYGYWNGAPEDQQIDFFYPQAKLELWNLTPPDFSDEGYVCVNFLGHRPYIVMFFESGEAVPFPMITETVLVDTEQMIISLTHKAWIRSDTAPINRVEARFSAQAEGELMKLEPELEVQQ